MRRGSARARGYTRAWDRLRNYHAVHEPLCRHCAARGEVKALDEVDHIVPIRVGGAPLDPKNLQSLCHQCHVVKTLEDQRRWPELRGR